MKRLFLVATMLLLPKLVCADDVLPAEKPAGAGFSSVRLDRIAAWYQRSVDEGALPGAVMAIAKDGKVAYMRAIGFQDHEKRIPMSPDSIFWIASMTKPVTSVAAMMLVEEGELDLDAPVSRYLPELKNMQVGVEKVDPATATVAIALEPQKREMSIRDLLRHTSGLVYPPQFVDSPIHRLYEKAIFRRDRTLSDFTRSLADLPLAHQPGEVWEYGWNADVLARVIEVQSKQSFERFLETRIFQPLRMADTGFYVPQEKLKRLVDAAEPQRAGPWDVSTPTTPPKLLSGGGGLVSSAPDYLRFCQMLLNGGELDGVRLLNPGTVREMTTNSLPADIRFAQPFIGPSTGSTWGLGFAVRTDAEKSEVPGSVGSYAWNGLWGTYFWIDPEQRMAAVQMIQVPPGTADRYSDAMRHLTYGALLVPDRTSIAIAQSVTVDGKILSEYAGEYAFGASTSPFDKEGLPYGGVGIDLSMKDGIVSVSRPLEGDPADRAGVLAGDTITRIDNLSTNGLTLDQAISRMRGPVGTNVKLTIERKSESSPVDISIERALIQSRAIALDVRDDNGRLVITSVGEWPVLDFDKGKPSGRESLVRRDILRRR